MRYFALLLAMLAMVFASVPAMAAPKPRTILFVGNSFTFGALSPVKRYRAGAVTDLNRTGFGGMPALFKTFTEEAGLNYTVSLETEGGTPLSFHWLKKRAVLDRAWDVVVLQEYSTLDPLRPGNAAGYRQYAPLLAGMFAKRNPKVEVDLLATWTRADLTFRPGSPWSGKPVGAMARDIRRAGDAVRASSPLFKSVIPVGEAWTRAIASGLADGDPYDGIPFGKIGLWAWDGHHASAPGYYLEALMVFGKVTGVDPTTLGTNERAADDLGIAPETAVALQRVAKAELAAK